MGADNKPIPKLKDAIDIAMNTEIVEPANSLPNFYRERYELFNESFIKYDAPIPEEDKKEYQFLQQLFQVQNQSLAERIKAHKIDVNEEIKPPQIVWGLKDIHSEDFSILGTLGNFSLVIGKAKSRKTFFIGVALATVIQNNYVLDRYLGNLPPDQNEVLYFDTEQGKYHVHRALKRACELSGIKEPKNLHTYFLRSFSPQERLEAIETLIYNNSKVGFVVIDGIRDLITSINDESEATMITSKLMKWTEERNIHIVTVLHQNKTDNNARGHIGTELINKAETILMVTKSETDKSISIVEPIQCRDKEPDLFAFEIINNIPAVAENFELRTETKKQKFDISDLGEDKIYILLKEVYTHGTEFSHSKLEVEIKIASKKLLGNPLGNNRITELITNCKINNWLKQEKSKAPYQLGDYFNTYESINF